MQKPTPIRKLSDMDKPSDVAATQTSNAEVTTTVFAKFWLLHSGTAEKLGLRSTGSVSFQVLADHDRKNLFIALIQNDGGGYFSKERVNMLSIESCLAAHEAGVPFPSRALKGAYKSRSSNNAGFLSATLRALGLTAAARDADSKHIVAGDWDRWRKKMIAEAGTLIELPTDADDEKQAQSAPIPDHEEHRKTFQIPAKKSQ